MPLQVTLLPNYIGLRDMKLLDTQYAIILPAVFTPFSAFLMTQYMRGLKETISATGEKEATVFLFLGYIVAVVWCVCVCACVKEFIVIPSEWIPRRLIDFGVWVKNMNIGSRYVVKNSTFF